MIGLGKALQDARQQGLKTDTVPGTPIYIDGISYLDPDMTELRLHMAKVLGIAADSQYLAVARRVAAEYENSLPKQTVVADKVEPPAAVDPDRLKAKAPEQPRRPDTPRLPVARESEPEAEKKRDKPKSPAATRRHCRGWLPSSDSRDFRWPGSVPPAMSAAIRL